MTTHIEMGYEVERDDEMVELTVCVILYPADRSVGEPADAEIDEILVEKRDEAGNLVLDAFGRSIMVVWGGELTPAEEDAILLDAPNHTADCDDDDGWYDD